MPDGVMQWYDQRRGEGGVVRNGREYSARAADVERHAQVPGARVHFDVDREGGVQRAVRVRLRQGNRVARRQRRSGVSAGARRPSTGPAHRPAATAPAEPEPVVDVVALDEAAAGARERAETKLRRVMALSGEPVLFARVKLALAPDPAVERPALAQATLDLNGGLVRAQVAAHSLSEAVDLLEARLRDRLEHRAEQLEALRHRPPGGGPGQWRHGQPRSARPVWFDRPLDEREVVRRRSFAPGELTVDEAAFDLESLGFDFYLFRELATGGDALLYRRDDGRYGLRRLHPAALVPAAVAAAVVLEGGGAGTLTLDEAVEWLGVTGEPFVFYADRDTGGAHVLYRRFDGHYGLISAAGESVPARFSPAGPTAGEVATAPEAPAPA